MKFEPLVAVAKDENGNIVEYCGVCMLNQFDEVEQRLAIVGTSIPFATYSEAEAVAKTMCEKAPAELGKHLQAQELIKWASGNR